MGTGHDHNQPLYRTFGFESNFFQNGRFQLIERVLGLNVGGYQVCVRSTRTGGTVDGGKVGAALVSYGLFNFRRVDAYLGVIVWL